MMLIVFPRASVSLKLFLFRSVCLSSPTPSSAPCPTYKHPLIHVSLSLCLCFPVFLLARLSICLPVCLYPCMPSGLFFCPSVRLPVSLSVSLSHFSHSNLTTPSHFQLFFSVNPLAMCIRLSKIFIYISLEGNTVFNTNIHKADLLFSYLLSTNLFYLQYILSALSSDFSTLLQLKNEN